MSRIEFTRTLISPFPDFPLLLPTPPQPHPIPLPTRGRGSRRMNDRRDLVQEIEDLSEEENEFLELRENIKNRGSTWLIPLGKQLTLQEEKNDASSASSDSGSASNGPPSNADDAENESAPDLDASMVDMDDAEMEEDEGATGDVTTTTTDDLDNIPTANVSIEEYFEVQN